ncbi:cold-shock protein [Plantactinospora solaniradicis]|uniref:Cold-shock protein n=1 Tax=Plantactinospora solaniradicis TaxID=1723736 RepID=A0ABW1KN45_9ACTN
MAIVGVLREFDSDRGWGVIDAPETPGGCWVHFSAIAAPGFRALAAGQQVYLRAENADQDGYAYRAVKVWTGGPGEPPDRIPDSDPGARPAYRSTLTIVYDDPTDGPTLD